jgi:hypothetical protein
MHLVSSEAVRLSFFHPQSRKAIKLPLWRTLDAKTMCSTLVRTRASASLGKLWNVSSQSKCRPFSSSITCVHTTHPRPVTEIDAQSQILILLGVNVV